MSIKKLYIDAIFVNTLFLSKINISDHIKKRIIRKRNVLKIKITQIIKKINKNLKFNYFAEFLVFLFQ